MGTFSVDFDSSVTFAERKRLHSLLWSLFSAEVERRVRLGEGRWEAERAALEPTRAAFIASHPDLQGRFAVNVTQP